jgi:hypothetical protein
MSFYDPSTLELLGAGPVAVGFVVVDGGNAAAESPLARFGECMELLAVDIPPGGWSGASKREVHLTWQRVAATCGRYTMFVHLVGPEGLVAQSDQEPLHGFYPSDAWLLRVPVADSYELALPPDLAAGDYQLLAGLYDPASGQRVPLLQDGAPAGDAYLAATIRVAPTE